MTKRLGNQTYNTISDLAKKIGISVSTARRYISKGILPRPPRRFFASQSVAVFPDDYIEKARLKIKEMQDGA